MQCRPTRVTFAITLAALLLLVVTSRVRAESESPPPTRNEIRAFTQLLVVRQVTNDIASALERKGFAEDTIQEVLKGHEFRSLIQKLLQHPEFTLQLDEAVDRILDVRARQALILRERAEMIERRNIAFALSLQAANRNRQLILHRASRAPAPTLWERFWTATRRYLLE